MLGLNWNVMDGYMAELILTEQLLVGVLIVTLMWLKYLPPTVRTVLTVVAFLQLVRIGYWLVVMLTAWSLGL